MKKINKTITLICVMLITCFAACKPTPPLPVGHSGANVLRYKVNGQQIEISGKWDKWTEKGVGYSEYGAPYNSINFGGNINNNRCSITLDMNKFPSIIFYTDSLDFISISNVKGQAIPKDSSVCIKLSNNNNIFISGTFSGILYYSPFNQTPNDSIIITDGYFDIAK
jgi:hypothetical protein